MESLVARLHELKSEHRKLDEDIITLSTNAYFDQLMLQRLKKRKLWLKDQIVRIESKLIPDLDA